MPDMYHIPPIIEPTPIIVNCCLYRFSMYYCIWQIGTSLLFSMGIRLQHNIYAITAGTKTVCREKTNIR